MKYFSLIIISFLFISCSSQVEPTLKYIEPVKTINQEVNQQKFLCDSALEFKENEVRILHIQLSALKDSLFIAKYKIEGVKKYLKICDKNPSQIKFLRGWIHRAID